MPIWTVWIIYWYRRRCLARTTKSWCCHSDSFHSEYHNRFVIYIYSQCVLLLLTTRGYQYQVTNAVIGIVPTWTSLVHCTQWECGWYLILTSQWQSGKSGWGTIIQSAKNCVALQSPLLLNCIANTYKWMDYYLLSIRGGWMCVIHWLHLIWLDVFILHIINIKYKCFALMKRGTDKYSLLLILLLFINIFYTIMSKLSKKIERSLLILY